MAQREGYNGWTNHATWAVNLHLDEIFIDIACNYLERHLEVEDGQETYDSEYIETLMEAYESAYYEAIGYDDLPLLVRDLLSSDIDFRDIAETHAKSAIENHRYDSK